MNEGESEEINVFLSFLMNEDYWVVAGIDGFAGKEMEWPENSPAASYLHHQQTAREVFVKRPERPRLPA